MADENDVICTAIKRIAAAAREAGVVHVSVNAPLVGQINLTLATPAPAPAEVAPPVRLAAVPSAGPRKGPASRLAEFHAKTAKQKHDILFAASSVKPKFTPPEPSPTAEPRAVRDRKAAARGSEEAGG